MLYDPAKKEWKYTPSPPSSRTCCAVGGLDPEKLKERRYR
jgi:hypothetical protein